jgi:hypothetical protein
MAGKAGVRLGDQRLVEPLLRHPRFVTCHQHDGTAFGIERERHAPDPIVRRKPQFLHIAMFGASERIGMGPAQHRPRQLEKPGCRKQFDANSVGQSLELGVERGVVKDSPFHKQS